MKKKSIIFLGCAILFLTIILVNVEINNDKEFKNNSSSRNSSYSSYGYSSGYSNFTNKYGTRNTKCAHRGCSKYIASSGDTNCCTTHSRKCLECHCYIDEDATWCMDCIANALK